MQRDGTSKRLPAFGEKTGRRLAWLVYVSDKRHDQVRGKPLLALILQSLKEIDRYRDSTQRKATINSMLAMFMQKDQELAGSRSLTGGAIRAGTAVARDDSGKPRRFKAAEHVPGLVMEELQAGEKPVSFGAQGTDERFGEFEKAIVQAIGWTNEIPPEILQLSFNNNYSASQAAINEFKMALNRGRTRYGETFCQPVYVEWLIASVLAQKVSADGLIEAWRDWTRHDVFCAWTNADWSGHIKPAVDMSKLVGGYDKLIVLGAITRARATRELTGMKYSRVVRQLRLENEALARAQEPLRALEAPAPAPAAPPADAPPSDADDDPDDIDREDDDDEGKKNERSE